MCIHCMELEAKWANITTTLDTIVNALTALHDKGALDAYLRILNAQLEYRLVTAQTLRLRVEKYLRLCTATAVGGAREWATPSGGGGDELRTGSGHSAGGAPGPQ
jgi:hypothetical protein